MPLREDLLQPIPGDNPSGISLRYDRVFDQVKEARAEEDDTLPAGAWERTAKRADVNLVLKLAGDVLATKSKDLQFAAWLGEAHIKKEGAALVAPVLKLLLDLQKEFWETIYPEIDEGDVGMRAMPLQWAANRYSTLVYEFPITKSGVTYYSYKSGRALGYAADAEGNESKKKARDLALKRGQMTAEEVDEGISKTPKSLYAGLDPLLQEARDGLEELALYCEEQYRDDGPSFRKLRDSLDEVHNLVNSLLAEKRKTDPDPVAVAAEPEPEPPAEPEAAAPAPDPAAAPAAEAPSAVPVVAIPATATASPASSSRSQAGPPASWDDATAQVHALASFMSGERPGSSVPYLLHSSIRWGEIRKAAPNPPLDLLVSPPTEIRSGLKLAASEKNWSIVLSTAMKAMAEPCARCWLDLHRYLWTATKESGYAAFSKAVVAAVQGILKDFPQMPEWAFSDDTPVANAETLKWIAEELKPDAASAAAAPAAKPTFAQQTGAGDGSPADGKPDVFADASKLAAAGQLSAATALLARDATMQSSGRMKSQRRVEIAELCLIAGNASVAASILREVVTEMEQRRLDTWEAKETVARPLALLLRCTAATEARTPEWENRFTMLCALDPGAALEITVK